MRSIAMILGAGLVLFGCIEEVTRHHSTGTTGTNNNNTNGGDPSGGDSAGGDSDLVPTVTIGATCPALTPCGGTVTGTWRYSEACFSESELFAQLYALCPSATVSNVVVDDFFGTLTFASPTVSRDVSTIASGQASLPPACTFSLPCSFWQTQMTDAGFTGTCVSGSPTGTCVCTGSLDLSINDTSTYSLSGTTMVITGGGATHTYAYCVSGGELSYHDVSASNPEPGIYTLVP